MKRKLFNFWVYIFLRSFRVDELYILLFSKSSFLRESGWFSSVFRKESVDKDRAPLPWLTYSCIKFLEEKLDSGHHVLEYGSGNSTVWLQDKVKTIVTIEHDSNWAEINKKRYKKNVQLIPVKMNVKKIDYSKLVFSSEEEKSYTQPKGLKKSHFDIIIVDGILRTSCVLDSFDFLAPNGVYVVDNTTTSYNSGYSPAYKFLISKGFKRIDFWGMTPIVARMTCTTVFYRDQNCFNI